MTASALATVETFHPLKGLKSLRFVTSPEGEPQSVILSIEEFTCLMETLSIQAKTDLLKSIDRARQELRKGHSLLTFEEVFGEGI